MKGKFVPIPQMLLCNSCGWQVKTDRIRNIHSVVCINSACKMYGRYFALEVLELEEIKL